jgi:hypothetical protein
MDLPAILSAELSSARKIARCSGEVAARFFLADKSVQSGHRCREMLQVGGVISHSILVSWEEEGEVAVAVFALVSTAVVAELGSDSIGGDHSFVHLRDGRGVVAASATNGAIGHLGLVGNEADLGELADLLQVTIGDGSFGVVEGDQILLDVLGEGLSPYLGSAMVVIKDLTHPGFRSISSTQEGGVLRHYLS